MTTVNTLIELETTLEHVHPDGSDFPMEEVPQSAPEPFERFGEGARDFVCSLDGTRVRQTIVININRPEVNEAD